MHTEEKKTEEKPSSEGREWSSADMNLGIPGATIGRRGKAIPKASGGDSVLLSPSFQTSGFQNCESRNFCLNYPASGYLSQWCYKTNTQGD
jgi:hypothetical protein